MDWDIEARTATAFADVTHPAEEARMLKSRIVVVRARYLISFFMLLLLCGCGVRDPAKQKSESDKFEAAEEQLLADPAKARSELVRRLRAAVSMGGR